MTLTADEITAAGLHLDISDAVATVTLSRPDKRNAQTPAMWHALAAVGQQLPETTRVVVVRGAGHSFSAGLDRAMLDPETGDVARLLGLDDDAISAAIEGYQQGFTWLRDPRFVSIAAVQGYAIGAGFQLALSCDLRVVTEDVQLSMKEPALGLVPDLTGTKPLVEAVGYQRALEICATTRMVGAEEAVAIGLALTAVPADKLETTVADLAAALTANVAGAVAETKRLLLSAPETGFETQRRLEREAQVRRFRELAQMMTASQE
ncbi:MAG TPA: enoyl-CoA hydratase/isomerase family protein [Nocardioides sp.]|uniref:enoyl-CoA hydratase/isomerase family protein n=1 Tax=Nocardioides sp. TaxID=35761 RepID=UPI002E33AD98|nr:enoyl-CoA hydratase/isomerase family protein [Nocardioides sp.]HEX5088789.1 enoyl-CoA hydratase/isomerase family protein [Nocardioides sp.]